ncbi:MAG: biotin transport system substrate-specific component [Thermoanaerobaculia bacterium]|jgi:biotin transport system substrate-specific component|nr:biotin transport system substrate-specific component [Thermoanaerobaculia bacterium]
MQAKTATIPSALLTRIVRGRAALDVLLVIGASVFIAIAAQVAIPLPFSPVPLTLQPLAVILVGVTLGSVRGAAAAALYLLEGFSGLPVFALGHGGPMVLAGPTAGYLFSYPFAAFLAGWLSERGWGSNTVRAIAGMLAALGVIYIGGWSWLAAFSGAQAAWIAGVRPFLLADIVKVAIGASLLPQMQRLIAKI